MRRITVISAAALCSAILVHSALAQDERSKVSDENIPGLEISETQPDAEMIVTESATPESLPASENLLSELKVYPAF